MTPPSSGAALSYGEALLDWAGRESQFLAALPAPAYAKLPLSLAGEFRILAQLA